MYYCINTGVIRVEQTCINKDKSSVIMRQFACVHAINTPNLFMFITGRHAKHVLIMSN